MATSKDDGSHGFVSAPSPTPIDAFPLPGELIDAILVYLDPFELVQVSKVCRSLHTYAYGDRLWQTFVQENVPGVTVTSPYPCATFRELYIAHDPRWFLTKYKIWFSGPDMAGRVILVRYDQRRGCIEGYQLLAVSNHTTYHHWPPDANVVVHAFQPEIKLHLDRPVIQLDARTKEENDSGEKDPFDPSKTASSASGPRIHTSPPLRMGPPLALGGDGDEPPMSERVRPILMNIRGGGHVDVPHNFATGGNTHRQFLFASPLLSPEASSSTGRTYYDDIFHPLALALGAAPRRPQQQQQQQPPLPPPPAAIIHPNPNNPDETIQQIQQLLNQQQPQPIPPRYAPTRYPYYNTWPPPAVPSAHRVQQVTDLDPERSYPHSAAGTPRRRADISDHAFHTRTWMELGGYHAPAARAATAAGDLLPPDPPAVVLSFDQLDTYATVDPVHYTPTADKPFRGIWVGDYSGHGCEFLLVHQPDDPSDQDFDAAASIPPQYEGESDASYQKRLRDARIYRGRLEAIKLTGDPNVPRGEYTFVADDLGEGGFDCVMEEAPFAGVRIVKSLGHVAGTGFRNDRYVESRLILISPDRLAQYWVGFSHISFFERVDIDQFLTP